MQKVTVTIFWFRRDLRLDDNAALYYALKENENVLPIFIFDTDILNKLQDKNDRRVDFIHQALQKINNELSLFQSSLSVFYSTPIEVFKSLIKKYTLKNVFTNGDYEPYAINRDEQIKQLLTQNTIDFKSYKDQSIFEKDEVLKDDGKPYTVFTPYSRKWKKTLTPYNYEPYNNKKYYTHFLKLSYAPLPELKSMGFLKTDMELPSKLTLSNLLLQNYHLQRDIPSVNGTSKLSVHLRFGTISIRALVKTSIPISETWLNELIWRDFYMMILHHFPYVVDSAFKKNYNLIPWRNNEVEFAKWCSGTTGFAIVDAGMRELNATGFMHNRVRMIVSSFLVKDLLIDWRWGEGYFAQKLNDFDLSANNGGWQWAASSGCDAVPYFRIFNPTEQQKRFDPEFVYIKKWIPEFGTPNYPPPMLNHSEARIRAISVYKNALNESKQINLF